MNILLNGNAIALPAAVVSSWVYVSGNLLRQVALSWGALLPADIKAILEQATNSGGVNLSYTDPLTNASATLALQLHGFDAASVLDRSGGLFYTNISLVLREAPPTPP